MTIVKLMHWSRLWPFASSFHINLLRRNLSVIKTWYWLLAIGFTIMMMILICAKSRNKYSRWNFLYAFFIKAWIIVTDERRLKWCHFLRALFRLIVRDCNTRFQHKYNSVSWCQTNYYITLISTFKVESQIIHAGCISFIKCQTAF